VLDHRQLGLSGARGEKIDTARTLLVAEVMADLEDSYPLGRLIEALDIPRANDVSRGDRAQEMLAVWRFYPPEFIAYAYAHPPAWHKLVEPTRWGVGADEVVAFFRGCIETGGNWPSVARLRGRFGRASNHRPDADKAEGQGALL
jgi:hypothetical protein